MAHVRYYHVRCGGQIVYSTRVDDEDVYRCGLCADRGLLFIGGMIDREDRDEHSDLFNMLPTTFDINGFTVTVCGLITDREECNRIINEFLSGVV